MFKTPILFLIFNRPDTTQKVFSRIREIKPKYLFIAADGPRVNKEGEYEKCQQARQIVSNIDWDCEVKLLFRDENLGCKIAVSNAITWFFEHVEQGIILEDDCLAHKSFFTYCETLLDKYKDNEEVMHIGGNNFSYKMNWFKSEQYFFSAYSLIWGWATWRRTWNKFDIELSNYEKLLDSNQISLYLKTKKEVSYWRERFTRVKKQNLSSWAYIWQYSIWQAKGICITPYKNLVENIGFGEEATHTKSDHLYNPVENLKARKTLIKKHPTEIEINRKEDIITFKNYFLHIPTFFEKVLFKIAQIRGKV